MTKQNGEKVTKGGVKSPFSPLLRVDNDMKRAGKVYPCKQIGL